MSIVNFWCKEELDIISTNLDSSTAVSQKLLLKAGYIRSHEAIRKQRKKLYKKDLLEDEVNVPIKEDIVLERQLDSKKDVILTSFKENTVLVIPDAHVTNNTDLSRFDYVSKLIEERRPNTILIGGDFADMLSLSAWEKSNRLAVEGRRLKLEIDAVNDALDRLLSFKNRLPYYKPRLIFLEGNHECVSLDTEILTSNGWVLAKNIKITDNIASFDKDRNIEFNYPENLAIYKDRDIYNVKGNMSDELVTYGHNLWHKNKLTKVSDLYWSKINPLDLSHAGNIEHQKVLYTDDEIRLITWIVCDATIRQEKCGVKTRVQFKLSKERKIDRLKLLLDKMNINYTFRPCKKYGINKLDPYYIRFYSNDARKYWGILNGNKSFPKWFSQLDNEQAQVVIEELKNTDGNISFNHIELPTTNKNDADTLQLMCIFNNIPTKITTNIHPSGFDNAKPQYRVSIYNNGIFLASKKTEIVYTNTKQDVVAIQTKHNTLITRRNGKVSFTGNCRIPRYIESNPALQGIVGTEQSFRLKERGFEFIPYKEIIEIDGILYTHVPLLANGMALSGKYASQKAADLVNKSLVFFHTHTISQYFHKRFGSKELIHIANLGCFFQGPPPGGYSDGSSHADTPAISILTVYKPSCFDIEQISLDRLINKYKN